MKLDDVDWKRLYIALLDGCLRNESTSPNLDNIHESGWVDYKKLSKKELKATEKVWKERYKLFDDYMNDIGER